MSITIIFGAGDGEQPTLGLVSYSPGLTPTISPCLKGGGFFSGGGAAKAGTMNKARKYIVRCMITCAIAAKISYWRSSMYFLRTHCGGIDGNVQGYCETSSAMIGGRPEETSSFGGGWLFPSSFISTIDHRRAV